MGWPRRGGSEGRGLGGAPQLADPRVPAPLPAGRASFPNMVCSPPDRAHSDSVRGAGRPAHPPLASDPRTRSHPAGSPQPLPRDHRKCQQSESQENPSSQRGRVQTGACPADAPRLRGGPPGWRASRGALGSAGLLGGWRAPPRARASGKGGGGGRNPPGPRRAPRELPGPLHPGRPSHRRCEHVEQSGRSRGDRTVWGGPSWAAQRLSGGHTAAGAWHRERLSLRQLVPPAPPQAPGVG